MSAGEVIKLTRLGTFRMNAAERGAISLLKRLRGGGGKKEASGAQADDHAAAHAEDPALHPGRRPGRARLFPHAAISGSPAPRRTSPISSAFWSNRYADGPRRALRGTLKAGAACRVSGGRRLSSAPAGPRLRPCREAARRRGTAGTVGLLVMRSYMLAGNCGHYDGVIAALEARGLRVIPAFATGLDTRPAVEKFFFKGGRPLVDAVVSLTGFSLVGGPAYNDAQRRRGDAGAARRALYRRPFRRVPDARGMAGFRPRATARSRPP